jgi:transcriptional regulator with XRE-family HTH domain
MGELIRKARVDAGLSLEELAEKINRKRLAVSQMETGQVEISAWTLPFLAQVLNKPIVYFYPEYLVREFVKEEISPLEHELLIHFNNIWNDDLKEVAIQQVKVISCFDPKETILSALQTARMGEEADFKIREVIKNRPRFQNVIDSINDLLAKLFPVE